MDKPATKIGVLLVGHNATANKALTMLLQAQPDLEVVGGVANVGDFVGQINKPFANVILVDWDSNAAEINRLLDELRNVDQHAAVVALSIRADSSHIAMNVGVAGFAYKGDPPDRLLETIRVEGMKAMEDKPDLSHIRNQDKGDCTS